MCDWRLYNPSKVSSYYSVSRFNVCFMFFRLFLIRILFAASRESFKHWNMFSLIFVLFFISNCMLTFSSSSKRLSPSSLPEFLQDLYKEELWRTVDGRKSNLENLCNMHAAFVALTKTLENLITKNGNCDFRVHCIFIPFWNILQLGP